eukprot:CAMPEP_0170924618 /NCGR_PEP_ID=MMETSP0735-20130129/11777_1 /TAXON_ID=186038 /ORGANISM="Fragilariopsis kerguelensis, Strain L26-C5" /LENGTH=183 /DNA_ID=CAMNT_0011324505 /DNA_START=134 /DNA_END=686 /DNA_ORIENTATION=+
MSNENTSLKIVTSAGDSNTPHETVIGKRNTYQRPLLIVAGSLLALLVWIVVTGKSNGPYFKSSAQEITKDAGTVALADYQVDTGNSALKNDVFNSYESGEDGNGNINDKKARELKSKKQKNSKKSKNQKGTKKPATDISDLVAVSENDNEEKRPAAATTAAASSASSCATWTAATAAGIILAV